MCSKKFIIALLLTSLIGCSEHNEEYYSNNIDQAEVKVSECEALMKRAFEEQDKQGLIDLNKDSECIAARKVNSTHKNMLAAIKRQEQQLIREKEMQIKAENFSKEYKVQHEALLRMPYLEFLDVYDEHCKTGIYNSETKPICKAFTDLKPNKINEEVEKLKRKYTGAELEAYEDKACSDLDFNKVQCDLSNQAVKEQSKEKLAYYLDNYDELKIDFNECHEKSKALKQSGKRTEAMRYLREYKCKMVAKAAAKLKVYSFNKPIS